MKRGYKTSLVRCFRLQGFSYEELLAFCKTLEIEPPSEKNWNMEWLRCRKARETLRMQGKYRERALSAARFPTEKDAPIGVRAKGILSAARALAHIEQQWDVAKWAPRVKEWESRHRTRPRRLR
jgi:hypothetical protein